VSPDFDELVGTETTGAERQQLQRAHELLLQAGPPPELTPRLETAPDVDGIARRHQRRVVKRRAMLLLAAALSIIAVFAAGYAVADHRGGRSANPAASETLALRGTSFAPGARATLEVWHPQDGNWPMTLSVVGLPPLPPHSLYEVYLVRGGKPWGSCGTFRVSSSSGALSVRLNAPYALQKGDSWIVTRAGPGGEPGKTVLRPVSA
jgi:Anti-sigma-K factor rskA, C-terminal